MVRFAHGASICTWGQHLVRKGIQIPMAQGRSTEIISMIKWIRTSRLSVKNSLARSLSLSLSLSTYERPVHEVCRQPVSSVVSGNLECTSFVQTQQTILLYHTVEYDPLIKSQLASAIDYRAKCGADLVT